MTALIGIASNLRAVLTAHIPFQLVDRCRFRPSNHIQRDGLVSVATEAGDFKIAVTGIEGIAEGWRRLRRPFVAEQPHVPSLTRETIGFPARLLGALRGSPDGGTVDALSGFRGHLARMSLASIMGKPLQIV